jgi:hypothetical protein
MVLARQNPKIWPMLNEASLRGQSGSVDWVATLESLRLILRPTPHT